MASIKRGSTATPTKRKTQGTSRYSQYLNPTDQANQANLDRENEIRGYLDEIVGTYSPGGSFGAGYEAQLGRQRTQDLASGTQNLISSGLYGSTMTAGMPKKWEEEVGQPARLKLEDVRTQAYTQALENKAGFVERIENQSPSYETMANLTAQGAAAPQESLSDWLSQNFGSVPSATSTNYDAAKASNAQRYAKDQAASKSALAKRRAEYGYAS